MTQPRLHTLFEQRLALTPDDIFLHLPDSSLTLRQLDAMVSVLETELRAEGVLAGDRVLTVAENCPQHVALILACSRIGAWSCGVNARMARGEIEGFTKRAEPRIAYYTSTVSTAAATHASNAGAVDSALAGLQRSRANPAAVTETGPLAEQIAAIIFTSGTTGMPKGVLMSHAGLLQFGRVSSQSRKLTSTDRVYAYLPMTHIFGLGTVLMAALYSGAALVMRASFDPADLFDALANHRVSNLLGPPAMFSRLLSWLDAQGIAQPNCPSLRYLYTGAAPLDMTLKRQVEQRFGHVLHHGYGLSEYAGSVCVTRHNEPRDDTAAGHLFDGAELRIVDIDGRDLPAGERGEIWIRGVGLMPGYFRDPEATAQVIKPGGWYASGDIGMLTEDGALLVVGRVKEMIIRSGFNVYPTEVEAVLGNFPGIRRAAVVGRKQADGNEEILAYVETDSQNQPDLERLHAWLSDQLAPYKRPSKIIPVEAMPMTLSGKILKRNLLEMYPS